jgi:hypothetical protein
MPHLRHEDRGPINAWLKETGRPALRNEDYVPECTWAEHLRSKLETDDPATRRSAAIADQT